MNRKLICAALAVLMIVTLGACGKKEAPETTAAATTAPVADTQPAAEPLTLTSWSLSAETWSSPNGATIHFTGTPNHHRLEGESVTLAVRLEDEVVDSYPCTWEDGNYVADADLNAADGYCYYVVLKNADGTQTELAVNTPADPINESYINLQSSLTSYCSLTLGETQLTEGKLVITSGAASVQAPRITNEGESVACGKATLVLTLGEQEIATRELTMAPGETDRNYETALDDVSFDLPSNLAAGQKLTLRLDAELTNGRKLSDEGVSWYYQDGALTNAVG